MLGRLRLTQYPNREVRATFTPCQYKRSNRKTRESHNETDAIATDSPLTCHSLKTQNPPLQADSKTILEKKNRAGYGSPGRQSQFSTYARRTILRAGGALEQTYSHEECLFLTMTLPGSTDDSMRAIACWSGWLVDAFKSWLSKRLSSRLEMYVWEWQRRGALHLHYVVHCPDRAVGEWIRKNLQAQWIRLLDGVAEKSGIDVYAKGFGWSHKNNKEVVKVDAQWCEKSVAAYLSKYVSKESQKNRNRVHKRYYPSRWYGVSRPLLELLRKLTREIVIDNLNSRDWRIGYEECLSLLQPVSIACHAYKHNVGLGKTITAYVENQFKEYIWNQLMTKVATKQDSSLNTRRMVSHLIAEGLYLMKNNWRWGRVFSALSSAYVTKLVSQFQSSQPITCADATYLLDTLVYTLQYAQKTCLTVSGREGKWLSSGVEMNRISLRKELSYSCEWLDEKLAQPPIDRKPISGHIGTKPQVELKNAVNRPAEDGKAC